MAIDDRKQRIMMAIVSLYASDGEPIGSNLLCQYLDIAVSSATLRNEMAALTRLGLLEQPHTSAGRVPTAKGYRYYVDNLLNTAPLLPKDKTALDAAFRRLDYDPEKMALGAAKELAKLLGFAVITTTPRAKDLKIANFTVIQVGRFTAAVLAVTAAGGVHTRVAKVDFELDEHAIGRVSHMLNQYLRFVADADVDSTLIRNMLDNFGGEGYRYWPIASAALTLLAEIGRPSLYFEGLPHLLRWPEIEANLRPMLQLFSNAEHVDEILQPRQGHTTVLFGEELPVPISGLCVISRQYLAGGGLSGILAVVGPARISYREVIPKLDYFSRLLGQGMSGNAAL